MGYDVVETEVLIIGAGGAGVRTAIELDKNGVDCLILGKREHGDAHTTWAAGGINAALGSLDPEDRWDIHAADTLKEGHYINQPEAVEMLCKNVPERVLELQEWGCDFNLTDDGTINQRYFGAQAYRRTCFVGDHTGEALLETLVDRAKELDIPYRENTFITKILAESGKAAGAIGYDMETGDYIVFKATAVVLAAGGYTEVYNKSSSREDENTGDGPALAYDVGVPLRDMEMVQFHPTGMVKPEGWEGRLVTEAVRGEGGKLYNSEGERYMEKYSPKQMELDARDVVARANFKEIQEGRGTEDGGVLLDISHKSKEFIKERLPKMYRQFKEHGVDISEEPMEVAPTAHYSMGGVKIDFETGQTSVEGLFAVGEVTSGLHGGNRLGGNSLAEIVTFGTIFGGHIAEYVGDAPQEPIVEEEIEEHLQQLEDLASDQGKHDPEDIIQELRDLMWEHAGIVRTEEKLEEGLAELEDVKEKAESISVSGDKTGKSFEWALDLHFMLPVTEAILRGALEREESRAAHYREDHQDEKEAWRKNIVYTRADDGSMELHTEDVPPVPRAMKRALEEGHELDYHHLE
jgi:succinate dehydrogenase / fumarate reductase flavoprotein subunit